MSKHTQGPWHIARFEASTVDIRDARGVTVAEVGDTSMEDEANARLIAAAPELLEALKAARDDLRVAGFDATVSMLDEAIAKATRSQP